MRGRNYEMAYSLNIIWFIENEQYNNTIQYNTKLYLYLEVQNKNISYRSYLVQVVVILYNKNTYRYNHPFF